MLPASSIHLKFPINFSCNDFNSIDDCNLDTLFQQWLKMAFFPLTFLLYLLTAILPCRRIFLWSDVSCQKGKTNRWFSYLLTIFRIVIGTLAISKSDHRDSITKFRLWGKSVEWNSQFLQLQIERGKEKKIEE